MTEADSDTGTKTCPLCPFHHVDPYFVVEDGDQFLVCQWVGNHQPGREYGAIGHFTNTGLAHDIARLLSRRVYDARPDHFGDDWPADLGGGPSEQ